MDLIYFRKKGIYLRGSKISIRTPVVQDSEALANILCTDVILSHAMGGGPAEGEMLSGRDVLSGIEQWCNKTNSITMAIIIHDTAIGMISLSHIDECERSARIGYWLSSAYWRKGYGSEAFALTLLLALRMKITKISSNIPKKNIASLRIWAHYGAIMEEKSSGKVACIIDLSPGSTSYDKLMSVLSSLPSR
jgi:RimJ/RimL family protein N-acetyltransferase